MSPNSEYFFYLWRSLLLDQMVSLCMQSKPNEEVRDLISELITGPEAGPAFSETCPVPPSESFAAYSESFNHGTQ